MNRQDAESLIFAARDAALSAADAARLERYLAEHPEDRQLAVDFETVAQAWRQTDAHVNVPPTTTEWHAIRRRIRSGVTVSAAPSSGLPSWNRLLRFATPLAAATALVIALLPEPEPPAPADVAPLASPSVAQADWSHFEEHFVLAAHAEYVETDDVESSPFVYLDEESGWLIVWASDAPEHPSI